MKIFYRFFLSKTKNAYNVYHKLTKDIKAFVIKIFKVIAFFFKIKNVQGYEISEKKGDLLSYRPDYGTISGNTGYINEILYDLSIIIPFFNSLSYIEECIESIINQDYQYLVELIVVDDGSTDVTSNFLHKYLCKENITIISKNNGGQSAARNIALTVSRGKYVMFLDSDDILLPNSINALMKNAEKYDADIVEGNIVRYYNEITDEMISESAKRFHIESNKKNPKFVLTCVGYAWAKIYRRELWKTVRFPEGYIFEDVISKFILRRLANKVVFIEDVVYGYRWNNNSSSHGNNGLKKLDSIWVLPKVIELCNVANAPFDDVFYYLCLEHIGILNRVTTKSLDVDIQLACFNEMIKQLETIKQYRPKRMPLFFKLLDKAISEENFEAWKLTADVIIDNGLLKKYREIN